MRQMHVILLQMDVIKGHENFKREFPLLAAVDRCSNGSSISTSDAV